MVPKRTPGRRKRTMPGTFRELIREYVAERRVAAKSKKGASAGYLQFLQQGLEPLAEWGDTTGVVPADFDRPQFTRYLDSLKRRDGFQQKSSAGKDLAPSTWHAYARLARAVMIYAAEMGYITKAPKLDIVRPKPDPKLLSEDPLKQALAACRGRKGARDEAILCLMADSGIRRAELCSLVWGDLEYSKGRGYVHVRHGKGDKDRKSSLRGPTWPLLQASGKDRPHGPDDPVFLALDDAGPMKPAV